MLLEAIRRRGSTRLRSSSPPDLFVRVCGGYLPRVLYARAGEPIQITFLREEGARCSERVVFPAFGKSAMLPRGREVMVDLPAAAAGTYEFTCAMNVLHGTLIIEDAR